MEEVDNLFRDIRIILGEEYCNNNVGSIFYSGVQALQEGPFYLMGWNPGGDPKKTDTTIAKSLNRWLDYPPNWSEYTHERWKTPAEPIQVEGPLDLKEMTQHQRNVVYFCHTVLKQDVRRVFSANAVSLRTPKGEQLPKDVAMGKWWELHRLLMSHVRPKVLICLGHDPKPSASSFALVQKWLDIKVQPEKQPCGQKGKSQVVVRYFPEPILIRLKDGLEPIECAVIGIPHPSFHWYPRLERFADSIHRVLKALHRDHLMGSHEIPQFIEGTPDH